MPALVFSSSSHTTLLSLISLSTLLQPKDLVRLDVKGYKPAFPEKPHDELDDKTDEILEKQAAQRAYIQGKIDDLQDKLNAKVDTDVKNISAIKKKAEKVAKTFGDAFKNKTGKVNYTYSDAKIKGEIAVWKALYNKTDLGGLKNGSLAKPKWKPINLPKKSQNDLLQADSLKLNLTKLAFPTNPGKDPLRPLIDVITSDPVGDRIAGVTPFLTFRDPILKGVARSRTSVSTKVSIDGKDPTPVKVYDRANPKKWTDPKGGYTGDAKVRERKEKWRGESRSLLFFNLSHLEPLPSPPFPLHSSLSLSLSLPAGRRLRHVQGRPVQLWRLQVQLPPLHLLRGLHGRVGRRGAAAHPAGGA